MKSQNPQILWESIRNFLRVNRGLGESNEALVSRVCNNDVLFSRICDIDNHIYSSPSMLKSVIMTDEFIKSI
jgi:hypothetical protein